MIKPSDEYFDNVWEDALDRLLDEESQKEYDRTLHISKKPL